MKKTTENKKQAIRNFEDLRECFLQTQQTIQTSTFKAINIGLTIRNWLFGFYIVEYQQHGNDYSKYGEKLLSTLSEDLVKKGLKNVSSAELSRFRQFYTVYPQILGTLSQTSFQLPQNILGTLSQDLESNEIPAIDPLKLISTLSFSHFAELIKIENPLKRLFYEVETMKGVWSVRELRRQINTLFYERIGLSKKPEQLIERVQNSSESLNAGEIIKSPFTFEFLGLKAKDVLLENELEQALMDNLQEFLLELGNGFCFEARQKKILIEDEYFFIDLVFYNRILHCNSHLSNINFSKKGML